MTEYDTYFKCNKNWGALAVLGIIIFLIYSNTFYSSWHFDDFPNIVLNPNIQIEKFSSTAIYRAFLSPGRTNGSIHRPVSYFTFALNWYLGKDNVVGYHLVNTVIHILTAFFLFLTCQLILSSPRLSNRYKEANARFFIALLASVFWAVNPIQTQAVTYIVQRMASMCSMFYIFSILFYLKARISDRIYVKAIFFFISIIGALIAVGCKENAIMLPASLFLIEITFFQEFKIKEKYIYSTIRLIISVIVILVFACILMKGSLFSFLDGYSVRSFTLFERVLTEPRIIVMYISQIFYPLAERFSLMHDVEVSTSLLNPWTTLPALLFVTGMIGTGISLINKRPVISFSILFFFLNHLVESTIIPLELVYEHRNYLPSFYLFFPVSAGIYWGVQYYKKKNIFMYRAVLFAIFIMICSISSGTFNRNRVWASEETLWMDTFIKAPGLARPAHNLGGYYYETGQYNLALNYYKKALILKDMRLKQNALTLNSIGNVFQKMGNDRKAIVFYEKALKINPVYEDALYNMTLSFVRLKRWQDADRISKIIVNMKPEDIIFLKLRGIILINQRKYEEALEYLKKLVNVNDNQASFFIGVCLYFLGNHSESDVYLKKVLKQSSDSIEMWLWCIENSLNMDDSKRSKYMMEQLIVLFPIPKIEKVLRKNKSAFMLPKMPIQKIYNLFAEILTEKSQNFSTCAGSFHY